MVIRGVSCCIYYSSSWPHPLVICNSIRQHNRAGESEAVSNHHRGRGRGGEGDDHRICREIIYLGRSNDPVLFLPPLIQGVYIYNNAEYEEHTLSIGPSYIQLC